jgi:hypothetical protein
MSAIDLPSGDLALIKELLEVVTRDTVAAAAIKAAYFRGHPSRTADAFMLGLELLQKELGPIRSASTARRYEIFDSSNFFLGDLFANSEEDAYKLAAQLNYPSDIVIKRWDARLGKP